jgi:hypothetical protein
MLRLWLAMAVGVACLMVSGGVAARVRAQPSDPAAVITAYEMARNRRDIEAALTYFADGAVISQRNSAFTGKDEIRKFLDSGSARARFIVVSDRRTSGDHVTWTERSGNSNGDPARPPQANGTQAAPTVFAVNVEAVVQDGKIQSVAYIFGTQAARADASLDGRAQLPAPFGLAAVVAVMLSVLMIASTGFRRPGRVPSSLHGRLLHDLQGWASARQ